MAQMKNLAVDFIDRPLDNSTTQSFQDIDEIIRVRGSSKNSNKF